MLDPHIGLSMQGNGTVLDDLFVLSHPSLAATVTNCTCTLYQASTTHSITVIRV